MHAVRWPAVRENPLVVALVVGFLAGRVSVLAREPVLPVPDSPSYRGGSGLTLGDVLSFTGHSSRLWGTPLFYAIFPDDGWRAFGQWLIGTVAWVLLAIVVCARLREKASRVVAAAAILALGLLPQVTNWDFFITAESLSINLGLLALALLLWFLGGGGRPVLIALTVVVFWWTFTRAEIRLMAGVVLVVLIAYAIARKADRWAAAGAAAALVVAIGWVTAITPTMERTFAERSWNGLNLTEGTFVYRLRFQVMAHPDVLAVFKKDLGMPTCAPAESLAKRRAWAMGPFIEAYLSCPDLVAWGHENAGSSAYRFALADPRLYVRETRRVLPASLSGDVDRGSAVFPEQVEVLAFPSQRAVIPALPIALLAMLVAALAAGAFRRHRLLTYTALGLAAVSAVALVAELTLAAGDYVRFGIQEAVWIRVAILVLAVAALDAMISRRRQPASREQGSERDGGSAAVEEAGLAEGDQVEARD